MHKLYKNAGEGSTLSYISNHQNITLNKINNKNLHNTDIKLDEITEEFNYIHNTNSHNTDIILDEITEKI